MQRFSFGFLCLLALYVSANAYATPNARIVSAPVAASSVQAASAVTVSTPALPMPVADNPAPHIALLLPLKSKSSALARAAEAVQQGFLTASTVQRGLPVRVYSSSDETKEAVTLYRQAIANGAVAVAGPLTRDGVAALTVYSGITIPTVALNTTDLPKISHNLYFFGLPAENEARQIALLAANAKLRNATIISTGTSLSKRLAAAFAEEWKGLGGIVTAEVLFNDDFKVLNNLPVAPWPAGTEPKPASSVEETGEPLRQGPPPVAPGNVAFLAVDHERARLIRPYLNPTLPVYATSLIFNGNANTLANFDLNEIHFVDMPWLLQPDHPAVMIYPQSTTLLEPEVDRLYALGIDAYRLANTLQANPDGRALVLDGVTGRIHLSGQQLLREPIPAFFRHGLGLTTETLAALNAAKAAAKAAAIQAENAASAPSQTQ